MTVVSWYDPGTYYEPPDAGMEVSSQDCDCDLDDEHWEKLCEALDHEEELEREVRKQIKMSEEEYDKKYAARDMAEQMEYYIQQAELCKPKYPCPKCNIEDWNYNLYEDRWKCGKCNTIGRMTKPESEVSQDSTNP